MTEKKDRIGRPKKFEGNSFAILLPKDIVEWIDEIRKTPLGEISRPEVIRALIRRAMEEYKK